MPLIERPLSELEALHKREPTRAGLRSAYLAKRAVVDELKEHEDRLLGNKSYKTYYRVEKFEVRKP